MVVILLLCTACAVAVEKPEDVAREIRRVGLVRETWEVDWNDKRLDHIMTLYADDAVFFQPTAERTSGWTAIRSLFKKTLESNTPHITMRPVTIERSGNLAYDSGTYEETIVSAGMTRAFHGDYLLVLKRDGEGHWKIAQQTWTNASVGAGS
jgi:uncharacterized protein (TIGR02246 family)